MNQTCDNIRTLKIYDLGQNLKMKNRVIPIIVELELNDFV